MIIPRVDVSFDGHLELVTCKSLFQIFPLIFSHCFCGRNSKPLPQFATQLGYET